MRFMHRSILYHIKHLDKKRLAYALVLAIVLSVPTLLAFHFTSPETFNKLYCTHILYNHPRFTGYVLSTLAFFIILIGTYIAFGRLPEWLNRIEKRKAPRILPMTFTARGVLAAFLVLTIAWSPVFVAMFPGATTGYDTANQIYQFLAPPPTFENWTGTYVDGDFINGNPIFDTIIFGSFIWIGKALGSDVLGMFLYCIVQALLTALLFSTIACYSEKLGLPPILRFAALLAMALCPLLPNAAYTMQKDSLFSLFFTVYFLMYIEAFRTRGKALKSPRFIVAFIVIACFCCLSKQTGTYAVLASGLVMAIALKGSRIRSALSIVVPYAICSIMVPVLVFPAIGVWEDPDPSPIPGGAHVLLQQSITVLKKHPEAYNEEELETLDKVIDTNKALDKFTANKTDGVSASARSTATKEDVDAYLALWLRVGLRDPLDYILATMRCCGGHLAPTKTYSGDIAVNQNGLRRVEKESAGGGYELTLDIENPKVLQLFAQDGLKFYQETLGTVPVFSLLMTTGLYGGWIPLICFATSLYFRKRDAVALAPVIVTMLLLLVIPVSLARYVVPSIYLAFPAILWALHSAISEK